ncbi:hypothetical protein [Streptomyces sp. NPDC054765]
MATTTPSSSRKIPALKAVFTVLAALVATVSVQAAPATADDGESICGHQVGGDILAKYISLGRSDGVFGCPLTDELTNPDGVGRRQQFKGGSIYWKATTGAHPVWGTIGDKWGTLKWEAGALGYPVGDELTNGDGVGKRQQFEGGTIYWHPTLSHGAHPVWGKIGELWGKYGGESGPFGYPTSDEGSDEANKAVTQKFSSNNLSIFWSAGNGVEGCHGECVGYSGTTGTDWFKQVRVEIPYGTSNVVVRPFPTEAGFRDARTDFQGAWAQLWRVVPYPNDVSETEHRALYEQFACHSKFVVEDPLDDSGWSTGPTWDLESWHADVGMEKATSLVYFLQHQCNWD